MKQEQKWPMFYTVRDLKDGKKRELELECIVSDFQDNHASLLDLVSDYQEELINLEHSYINKGRKQNHNLDECWSEEKVQNFENLLYELGLKCDILDYNPNVDKMVDATFKGKVKIKNDELIILPTTGETARNLENDIYNLGSSSLMVGSIAGLFLGFIPPMIYDYITGLEAGGDLFLGSYAASAVAVAIITSVLTQKSEKDNYLTTNPFSSLAEEIGKRSEYIKNNLKK